MKNNMNMPNKNIKGLVSVGLPTYNRPESLKRALDIITSQTYRDLEIIVSDNASPGSRVKEVVEEFLLRDSRIKYYRQDKNRGLLFNTEFVLKKSRGEYFMWFSDDDWRSPEFIEFLAADLEKNRSIDMAFCDYHEVYKDGKLAEGYPATHLRVFKPFESRFRLIRIISYYWQNAVRGKCNIFYSLFRKAAIEALDLKKISGEYKFLNMDNLIVFSLLQAGPVSIRPEAMCALTCGNKKYYNDNARESNNSILSKFFNFWTEHKKASDLYVKNTNLLLEKVIIYFSFFPRFTILFMLVCLKKIFKPFARDKVSYLDKAGEGQMSVNIRRENSLKQKLELPLVTLVAMATRNVEETLQALLYSCRGVKFGRVKLLAHYTPFGLDVNPDIELVRVKKIKNIDEWSHEIIYTLSKYIHTDFALLVHADGFVVNPSVWRNEFLDYDYIGAPFPLPLDAFSYRGIDGSIVRVGNSVSLRSKRLLELPVKLNLPWENYHGFYNEDGFICVKNRHVYELNGMKFAPIDVAKYFAHERMIPEIKGIKPFAFHKWAGTNRNYPKF